MNLLYCLFCPSVLSPSGPSLFFFKDPPPTDIYTLSLHDALPISCFRLLFLAIIQTFFLISWFSLLLLQLLRHLKKSLNRSEERFSRNAETDLVCRLLLEKKKKQTAMAGLTAMMVTHVTGLTFGI